MKISRPRGYAVYGMMHWSRTMGSGIDPILDQGGNFSQCEGYVPTYHTRNLDTYWFISVIFIKKTSNDWRSSQRQHDTPIVQLTGRTFTSVFWYMDFKSASSWLIDRVFHKVISFSIKKSYATAQFLSQSGCQEAIK